jgi:hypothetical protein
VTCEVGQDYFAIARFDHAVMWGNGVVFDTDGIPGVAADGKLRAQREYGFSQRATDGE